MRFTTTYDLQRRVHNVVVYCLLLTTHCHRVTVWHAPPNATSQLDYAASSACYGTLRDGLTASDASDRGPAKTSRRRAARRIWTDRKSTATMTASGNRQRGRRASGTERTCCQTERQLAIDGRSQSFGLTETQHDTTDQSCPWVRLTHGLGWVGLGRDFFFIVFGGLGPILQKYYNFERIMSMHLKHG